MGNSQAQKKSQSDQFSKDENKYVNINKTESPTSDIPHQILFDADNYDLELLEDNTISRQIKKQEILLHPFASEMLKRWEEHTGKKLQIFGHYKKPTDSFLYSSQR